MPRILTIVLFGFLGVCVLCVGLGYFVALPRVQDELESSMEEAVSTYVVPYIAGPGVTPEAGTYVLSEEDVNREIRAGSSNLDDLVVAINPDAIEMRFGQQGQSVTYRAGVAVEDGRLDLTDANLDGLPSWVFSADTITNAVENGVNDYLEEAGLMLTDVSLGDGEMTLVTADRV